MSGRQLGRVGAALTTVGVFTHLWMAATGPGGALLALALLGLAVGCLFCASDLYRRPDACAWTTTAVMAGAMLLLHGPLMAFGGHHHGGAGVFSQIGLVTSGLQLAVAVSALAVGAMTSRQSRELFVEGSGDRAFEVAG